MLDTPLNPAFAETLAPAQITPCDKRSEIFIRDHVASAIQSSIKTQYRILQIASLQSPERVSAWKSGPEQTWFADYSDSKLNKLKRTFNEIVEILSSRRLRVVCDPNFAPYAGSLPGIKRIRLGQLWINEFRRRERIQTFIHEASHIAGRFMANESDWYEPPNAQSMAVSTAGKPMLVTRSAENYGYYSIEVAANFVSYL